MSLEVPCQLLPFRSRRISLFSCDTSIVFQFSCLESDHKLRKGENHGCLFITTCPIPAHEIENLLTYKQKRIERVLQVEASKKPLRRFSWEEMLQRHPKTNTHLGEECGEEPHRWTQTRAHRPRLCLSAPSREPLPRVCSVPGRLGQQEQTSPPLEAVPRPAYLGGAIPLRPHWKDSPGS